MVDLKVVIPNRNGAKFIRSCLANTIQALDASALSYVIVLVDNGSTDDSQAIVQSFPNVELIEADPPKGFSASNNLGASYGPHAEFLLFLNSDAYPLDQAIEILLGFLKNSPKYSAAGPLQVKPDGTVVQLDWRWHTPWRACFDECVPNRVRSQYYKWVVQPRSERKWQEASRTGFVNAPWLSGFCLLIQSSSFYEIGKWDEDFAFYCEDMDLCYRLAKAGKQCALVARSHFVHLLAASTTVDRRLREQMGIRAQVLFFGKHFQKSSLLVQQVFRFAKLAKSGVPERVDWWNEAFSRG